MPGVQAFRMTQACDRLLRGSRTTPVGLYQLQLATAGQLCRLHYSPKSVNWVKAQLKVLTDQGYVQAAKKPVIDGHSPYYYTLGTAGMRYLDSLGVDTRASWRAAKEINKGWFFLDHTLELNDVIISAALIDRADTHYRLESFRHERMLKRSPVRLSNHTLIPDAFLDFRMMVAERERRLPVLIEHDRGTEQQEHFRRRIRAYVDLLKGETYRTAFGVRAVTIAFTTFQGLPRLTQMREWTRAELGAAGETGLSNAFWFARLPVPPEPALWLHHVWLTSSDMLPQPLLAA